MKGLKTAALAVIAASVLLASGCAEKSAENSAVDSDGLKRAKKIDGLRGSAMHMLGWSVGPMGAMVKKEAPFDAAVFSKQAARVTALAGMVDDLFKEDLRAFDLKTEAKPTIWDDQADFARLVQALVDSSQALEAAAAGSDEEAITKAFKGVAEACKACHEKYKEDDH